MKDIVIISHPRSGSYWFQECIYAHDLNELFNIKNVKVVYSSHDVKFSDYTIDERYFLDYSSEFEKRVLTYESTMSPKVVKIHHYQLNNPMINEWIMSLDNILVVFLERSDKKKAFYSLLISNALRKFKGVHTESSVEVDLNTIKECWESIFVVPDLVSKIKSRYENIHLYYEDIKSMEMPDWFDINKARLVEQNTTESVEISNIDEVEKYIMENGYDLSPRKIL